MHEPVIRPLNDFAAEVDSSFEDGGSLGDVARQLSLTPQLSQALTADGGVYGKPGEAAPQILTKVLSVAFSMDAEFSRNPTRTSYPLSFRFKACA